MGWWATIPSFSTVVRKEGPHRELGADEHDMSFTTGLAGQPLRGLSVGVN
jgi:hypothetical protein